MSANPVNPRNGLFHCDHSGCQVSRPPLKVNHVPKPASLSILIYNFSSMPFDNQIELAWAASLVLVLIVLVFNILSRLFGRPRY